MVNITKEAALAYHKNGKPGKIEVKPTKPYSCLLYTSDAADE